MRLSHGFGAHSEPRVLAALSRRLCFTATPLPASLQLRGREGDTDGDTGGVTREGWHGAGWQPAGGALCPAPAPFLFPSLAALARSVSAGGGRLRRVSPEVFALRLAKHEFSKDLLNLPCLSFFSPVFPPVLPHGQPASQQSSCCAARSWQRAEWGWQKTSGIYPRKRIFTHPQLPARQQGKPAVPGDEKVKQEAKRESEVQSCLKTSSSLSAQGSLRICGSEHLNHLASLLRPGAGSPPACWGPRTSERIVQPLANPCERGNQTGRVSGNRWWPLLDTQICSMIGSV